MIDGENDTSKQTFKDGQLSNKEGKKCHKSQSCETKMVNDKNN